MRSDPFDKYADMEEKVIDVSLFKVDYEWGHTAYLELDSRFEDRLNEVNFQNFIQNNSKSQLPCYARIMTELQGMLLVRIAVTEGTIISMQVEAE